MLLRAGFSKQIRFELVFSAQNLGFTFKLCHWSPRWSKKTIAGAYVDNETIHRSCEHFSELCLEDPMLVSINGIDVGFFKLDDGEVDPKTSQDHDVVNARSSQLLQTILDRTPRPIRLGFDRAGFGRNETNESTYSLLDAIEKAGSFDEYARRLQRDVHVAIITKCFQEKLPLDIKTALTTYLWKWGGA